MIIGVDVDLTVVNMLDKWVNWYYDETGHEITYFGELRWNINYLMTEHPDPMSFWKNPNLYDNEPTLPNAKEVLGELSLKHDIIFVSHCMPEHENSKRRFIQENFPFHKGFISTGDKGYVRCDVFIDDSGKMLDKFPDTVDKILFENVLNKGLNYNRLDWLGIKNYFKEKGEI